MGMLAYEYGIYFKIIHCCKCNAPFMMTQEANDRYLKNHKSFYCPYCGNEQYYLSDSKEDILKKKLEAAERGAELARRQRDSANNRARAEKAAKTRIKNRIKNGVCPCCNRTFLDLQRHMISKHPNYVKS